MRKPIWLGAIMASFVAACSAQPSPPGPPQSLSWAYPSGPKTSLPEAPPGMTAPGSSVKWSQASASPGPVDWFPQEHPPAPASVAHVRKGSADPCAECHLYDGHGYPGAADLGGLRAAYIIAQVKAFRAGARRSAQQPDRPDTTEMIAVARKLSDAELAEAARYFASLKRQPFVRVVESRSVPVTKPSYFGWLDLVPNAGQEPIAGRIVELPEDPLRLALGDPHNGLVDYVPVGSLARGAALVESGGPGAQPCARCHGAGLRGTDVAPPLAGRSAAYLARMLWDIKTGARGGPGAAQMQAPARPLNPAQITDIVAYLASLPT